MSTRDRRRRGARRAAAARTAAAAGAVLGAVVATGASAQAPDASPSPTLVPVASPAPAAALPAPAPGATAIPALDPPAAEVVNLGTLEIAIEPGPRRRRRAAQPAEPAPAPSATPTPAAEPLPVTEIPALSIEQFAIPPFLLPIYQAAGIQYGVRWEILAAINQIETDFGRNLNVSSAGAVGWMQFMPATWEAYGLDANADGDADPYSPVDAIFSAARYLKAAGAAEDLRTAVFAYNHADWYVRDVLARADRIASLPVDLISALSGLVQGHFPLHARATFRSDAAGTGAAVRAERGVAAIAAHDTKVVAIGRSRRLGRFVRLRDVFGNTYTYGRLASITASFPAPRTPAVRPVQAPERDPAPGAVNRGGRPYAHAELQAAPAGRAGSPDAVHLAAAAEARSLQLPSAVAAAAQARGAPAAPTDATGPDGAAPEAARGGARARGANHAARDANAGERRLWLPSAARVREHSAAPAEPATPGTAPGTGNAVARFRPSDVVQRALRKGARVPAGTILGRVGERAMRFEIRPHGVGAPRIDPAPILEGWRLLGQTDMFRATAANPFIGSDADRPSIGQVLLLSKEALIRRVLEDERITIYPCGRDDVRLGVVDRRVLAALEILAISGLHPKVTSLRCGHSVYTASGNVSHHSSGNAADIGAINGTSILGHQGPGTVTEAAVRRLLTLQGDLRPDQIISLMTFEGADNTFSMGDHHDHIHVGWRPLGTLTAPAAGAEQRLAPSQWSTLVQRLGEIRNPEVRR